MGQSYRQSQLKFHLGRKSRKKLEESCRWLNVGRVRNPEVEGASFVVLVAGNDLLVSVFGSKLDRRYSFHLFIYFFFTAAQETKADAKDSDSPQGEAHQDVPGMLFRCLTCNRVSHYACLEDDGYSKFEVLAEHYFTAGQCHDCYKFTEPLDVILAWAESDPLANSVNDVEKGDIRSDFVKVKKKDDKGKMYIMPNHKDPSSNAKVSLTSIINRSDSLRY